MFWKKKRRKHILAPTGSYHRMTYLMTDGNPNKYRKSLEWFSEPPDHVRGLSLGLRILNHILTLPFRLIRRL
jgi:hypothetical protein